MVSFDKYPHTTKPLNFLAHSNMPEAYTKVSIALD
jgi:hypothetical protein